MQKSTWIAILVVLLIGAAIFAYADYKILLRSSQQSAQQRTIILDRTFTCDASGTMSPDSCGPTWPDVHINITVNKGWNLEVRLITSSDVAVTLEFAPAYLVSANQGNGNPPDVRTFTVFRDGFYYMLVTSMCVPHNCHRSFTGQLTITRLS